MEDQIGNLRAAGFNDDEIGAWTAEKRGQLSAAGFKENEIDAYFVGGVTAPDHVPSSIIGRFSANPEATMLQNARKLLGGNITDRIGDAMMEGGAAGFGQSSIGLSPEDTKKMQDLGIFRKPDAPLNWASGLQFANEALIRPLAGAIESVFRSANAAIYGVGAGAGQAAAEATGADETTAAKARRDGAQMAMVSTLLAMGNPVSRSVRTATGEIATETVGVLPKAEDFVASARAVGGDAAMATQEKMLKLYEEKGIHPAEVAADATTDPVIQQRILSSDKLDMPEYGGGKEPPVKEPPAPKSPEPPEPGSFAEAQQKVLDKVSVGDRDARPMSWSKLYTEAIDDLHPIKAVSEDAYQAARLTRGQFGKAEHFIEQGTFDFNTLKNNGKPLKEVLEPVRNDLEGLRAYLTSKRAIEIEATERKSGIDMTAAQRVVSEGAAKYEKVAGEIGEYQTKVLQYLKDSGVVSEGAFKAMTEANKNYVPFYRVFTPEEGGGAGKGFGPGSPLKALKGSDRGIVDPLESIIKNTYAYVSIAEQNAVGVKIIDALQEQGLKSKTAAPKATGAEAELIDYLKQSGVAEAEKLVDFVKASAADDGTTISAWRDGKRISVETGDAELVRAFRGLDEQSTGLLTKVFAAPAKTLRAGSVLTPDFMARNVARDFMTAFINSKGLFSPIDTFKGAKSAILKDDVYSNWVKSGGANATMVALDRRYMQESLVKLTADTGLGTRAWNVVTSPLAGLRMASELLENATRLGEFSKALGEGGSKAEMQSAAYASREVTLDFARIGAKMRAYNMVTAFANAQIQGMDRIVRGFADRPVNTSLKVVGGITLPSVLLWFANHDDPRYQELPDWQKDLFWIIPTDKWESISAVDAQSKPDHLLRQKGGQWEVNNGHIWRIPKPFELGVIFGSGAERALCATIGQDKEAFDGFAKSVQQVLVPSFTPTAVQPVIEQWANRSSFTDRTLIPADVEKQLPEYQYTPYTTELSKALGKLVAAFPGVREASTTPGAPAGPAARSLSSPILIENYVRSWTGGLGMYALQLADYGLRKAGELPDPVKPTATLADIPFVRAFAVRYPSATTESIQKFYDEHERDKRFFDTWMAKAREGDAEAMQRIETAGGPRIFARMDAIKEVLSEHSKLVRDIYKNPEVPAEEKRQLIDGLYYSMIEIGKAGRKMMTEAKEAMAPPQ